jgi:hypothetical protein
LLEGIHQLSTDSGATEGFDHQQFIDRGHRSACVKGRMAVPGDVSNQSSFVLGYEQAGRRVRQFRA